MIELLNDVLAFSFPEVHPEARCRLDFQRTLRIPDDNQCYPLPAGLGRFPLHHVDDYKHKLPESWRRHGGVFLPLYQSEALWVYLLESSWSGYPCAVKIAAGKINAISGGAWRNDLVAHPQDYVVATSQFWVDGFAVGEGLIRQFVAMPLGAGFTAEEQITGEAAHGGLQLAVYPMKRERYEILAQQRAAAKDDDSWMDRPAFLRSGNSDATAMGLAPGGLMRQTINQDPYGVDAWDQTAGARCFVHLVDSLSYYAITGHLPPQPPLTAKQYAAEGIPWFDAYAADKKALPGSVSLAALDSLAAKFIKVGRGLLPGNKPIKPRIVISLMDPPRVREGDF